MSTVTRSRDRLSWIFAALLLQAAVVLPASPTTGQDDETRQRPRVILALGGGGAKGAAHIGVLRELEALRVPIDGIVGTSIGSIVGGLYATGLSLDEIERTMLTLDWTEAFRDSTARDLLSFRRKEDEARLKIKARIGIKKGRPTLPLGLIQGQKLHLILRRLTLRAATVQDFDELPIPFRSVTMDLETGEAVVLGSGDLVTAIRASMSIPAVFEPVELDGRLLIDGGSVSNLPIREARAMGADVVIAVDVGSRPLAREQISDPVAAATQTINILMSRETDRQIADMEPQDILLQPDLRDVDVASFLDAAEIIPRGTAVARAAADRLQELSLSEAEYLELRRAQSAPPFVPPRVTAIRVTEDARIATGYITSRLHTAVGDRLEIETLNTDLERVYGLGIWESVGFRLFPDQSGTDDDQPAAILEIEAREKAWGTSYLRLGLDVASDFEGTTSFDLGVRYTAMPVNRLGGEWRNDLSIGELVLLRTEFYQPLNVGGFFVAPRVQYRETNVPLILAEGLTTEFRLSSTSAALDIGRELGTWGEIRVGLDRTSIDSGVVFGSRVESPDLNLATASLRFATDTLDSSSFPTRGLLSRTTLRQGLTSFGGEVENGFAEMQLTAAKTFGRHTINVGVEAASTIDEESSIAPYTLGGFLRLSGLEQNELRGDSAFLGRLIHYRRLGGPNLLGQPVYAGFSLEAGNAWPDADAFSLDDLVTSGSLFLGADTALGPAYLGVGIAENDAREYYFIFGRPLGQSLSPIFD